MPCYTQTILSSLILKWVLTILLIRFRLNQIYSIRCVRFMLYTMLRSHATYSTANICTVYTLDFDTKTIAYQLESRTLVRSHNVVQGTQNEIATFYLSRFDYKIWIFLSSFAAWHWIFFVDNPAHVACFAVIIVFLLVDQQI